jgi:hypothetical protein
VIPKLGYRTNIFFTNHPSFRSCIEGHVERSSHSGGVSNFLFFLILAIIVAGILIFVVLRPGG